MLDTLRQLGWGEYEARAYLALLRHSPATGYRVGKESGVPVAKVYEALARLVERGAVRLLPATEGETARYVPIAPDEVMAGLRARHLQMLDTLTRELMTLHSPASQTPEAIWLKGRAPVLGRAHALLSAATSVVALALPHGWEGALRPESEAARARSARVDRIVLPSEGDAGRPGLFVLAVDGAEALIGTLGAPADDAAAEALATRAPFLVRLCTDYVRLCRAVALVPEAVARLQRHDDWLDWEEAKQRRLLEPLTNRGPHPRPLPQ